MREKGQASIEAMLILGAVIIAVGSLQLMGINMNEKNNAMEEARKGVQTAITKISLQSGNEINISDWDLVSENIVFYLIVQGSPPPSNDSIKENVESIAQNHLSRTVGIDYKVAVEIEERVSK